MHITYLYQVRFNSTINAHAVVRVLVKLALSWLGCCPFLCGAAAVGGSSWVHLRPKRMPRAVALVCPFEHVTRLYACSSASSQERDNLRGEMREGILNAWITAPEICLYVDEEQARALGPHWSGHCVSCIVLHY